MQSRNDDTDALYRAVGFVVVQWGQAEQTLDMLVAMLYQEFGGKRHAKRLPKMLDVKLKFVDACFSSISQLAALKTDAGLLVAEFRRLSQMRHDLIHGAVASLTPKDGAFLFAKLDIKKDLHHLREVRLRATEFPALTKGLVDLGSKAISLAQKVFALMPKSPGRV